MEGSKAEAGRLKNSGSRPRCQIQYGWDETIPHLMESLFPPCYIGEEETYVSLL